MSLKVLLIVPFLLFPVYLMAQNPDTLIYERFETGGTGFTLNSADHSGVSSAVGYNQWIINNAYTGGSGQLVCSGLPTTFTVPNTPSQPVGITGGAATNYMHIISDAGQASGILNCSYLAANGLCGDDEYNFSRMALDVTTTGYDSVTVSFIWLCAGAPTIYGQLYYSTNSGNSWTLVTSPVSQFSNQSNWITHSISLPVFAGQNTLRFGFRFVNEVSFTANDPGFAIDEFLVTAKNAVPPPVAAFSVSDSAFCETTCVDFTDLSTNSPTSWFWIFQGSTTSFSTQQNPAGICYNTPGSWPVTLIVENGSGTDTLTVSTITVYQNPLQPVITVSGDTLFATPGFSTYEWYLDSVLIPGATGDSYVTATNGNYYVTATDSNGCSASSLPFQLNTGLFEMNNVSFDVYPNPTHGKLNFKTEDSNTRICINNPLGELVFETTVYGKGEHEFDLSDLSPGYYHINLIRMDGSRSVSGFVKLRAN